jgi:ABC-type transporter Mla MlaB component
MYFYSDLDSLLWLQKQYKNIDNDLKNKINDKTKLLSLEKNNFKLKELLNLYNIDNILKLVFEVPKST